MSASVVEYQDMQRELFGLIDAFVVLNETARRFSPHAHAIASKANTPNADCNCSMNPPAPRTIMPAPHGGAMPSCSGER